MRYSCENVPPTKMYILCLWPINFFVIFCEAWIHDRRYISGPLMSWIFKERKGARSFAVKLVMDGVVYHIGIEIAIEVYSGILQGM